MTRKKNAGETERLARLKRNIARNLSLLRERAGLSVRDVYDMSGVAPQTVSQLEQAATDPRMSTLLPLARAFGVTVEDLAADEEPPEPRLSPAILKGQFRAMMPDEPEEVPDEMVDNILRLRRDTMLSVKKILRFYATEDSEREKIERQEAQEETEASDSPGTKVLPNGGL